jgi:hypothetical protein
MRLNEVIMKKTINHISLLSIGLLLSSNCLALDMEVLKEQCAEIGFKINTPDNGKCVIRLMKTDAIQKSKEEAEQRALQNQQALRAEEKRLVDAQNRQQAELLELQRRSIAVQENMAKEQQRDNSIRLLNSIANPPKTSINCTSTPIFAGKPQMGSNVNCN